MRIASICMVIPFKFLLIILSSFKCVLRNFYCPSVGFCYLFITHNFPRNICGFRSILPKQTTLTGPYLVAIRQFSSHFQLDLIRTIKRASLRINCSNNLRPQNPLSPTATPFSGNISILTQVNLMSLPRAKEQATCRFCILMQSSY